MSEPRLYRVEFRVVSYAVAPDPRSAVRVARDELTENATMHEADSVTEADAATARRDGWDDCIPWGGDGETDVGGMLRFAAKPTHAPDLPDGEGPDHAAAGEEVYRG